MSTTEATIAENTASTAIETDANPLSDAALDKIFAEPSPDADSDEGEGEPEGNAADAATQLAAASEGKTPETKEGIDLSLLTDETDDKAAPAEDPYIKTVKEFLPNETALRSLIESSQRTTALEAAVQRNDPQAVFQALGSHAEPIFEMFYQAAKDRLVERYINEAQGNTNTPNPEVTQLKQQLAQVTNFLQNGIQQQRQQLQTESQRKALDAIHSAIERDLTTARFPDDPFHKVQRDLLRQSVIADLAQAGTLTKALSGDMKLVRQALKARLSVLVEADKQRQTTQAARRTQQETTKPIISGQAPAATASTKDGERDYIQEASDWLDKKIKRGK